MGRLLAAVAIQFMLNGVKGVRVEWLRPQRAGRPGFGRVFGIVPG
jgi:hypothetical protein